MTASTGSPEVCSPLARAGTATAPLASLLQSRLTALLLTGIAALQLALTAAGLPGWPCPLGSLGIPCPGCGLTRAALELLRGDWRASFAHHAFAPVLLLACGAIAAAALLPERLRRPLIDRIGGFERRTGLTALVLTGLVLYWIARWTFARETLLLLAGGRP
jgi:hypothetical protein